MIGNQECWQEDLFVAGPLPSLIPDDHILKQVDNVLDLSWLRTEVSPGSSCMPVRMRMVRSRKSNLLAPVACDGFKASGDDACVWAVYSAPLHPARPAAAILRRACRVPVLVRLPIRARFRYVSHKSEH